MVPTPLKLLIGLLLALPACTASPRPVGVQAAQAQLAAAWRANQHAVWEIAWPAAPVGSPLTVEVWRAGASYRYEILESAAPALVGATLVYNGQTAWSYNRLEPESPVRLAAPALSPVTDALAVIDQLLARPADQAAEREVQLEHGPAVEVTLTYPAGQEDRLTFWYDPQSGLPVRVHFSLSGQEATLQARSYGPLAQPPPGLFEPLAR